MKLTDKGGGNRQLAPEGTHVARCFAIIDLGTQATEFQGRAKKARKILIGFELPEETHVFDEAKGAEPFSVWSRYTASLHSKSQLRPMLESWRGRAFTEDELAGFNPKNLVGAPCMLSVIHEREYANIKTVSKCPKSVTPPDPVNDPIFISLEPDEFNPEAYAALSDKLKETIEKSPEWKALKSGRAEQRPSTPEPDLDAPEDDIPF